MNKKLEIKTKYSHKFSEMKKMFMIKNLNQKKISATVKEHVKKLQNSKLISKQ